MRQRSSKVDLHIHSTASDGVLTPSEVVRLARERELDVIALTDHDTLSGVAEAQRAAAGAGPEVIAGVEINSEGEWGALHFLGYYVDPDNGPLRERLQAMLDARLSRAYRMIRLLDEMGLPLDWEEVRALAGGESIGRPHLARALVNRGYVETTQEAFERFIARDGPAYVPRPRLSPPDVIRAIVGAGGVPVLAHPAHSGPAAVERVPEFVGYGLRGVEVYYPDHSPEQVEMLLGLCQEYRLLVTGGSDFHGPGFEEGAPLGSVYVPAECAERLREEAAAFRTQIAGQ